MPPERPTLFYFNFRGRAELCRLTLAVAGIEHEDVRFTRREWADTYRSLSPSGRCPFLQLPDGRVLTQSLAIARHFARAGCLYGRHGDQWDAFLIDQAVQAADDLEEELLRLYRTPEAERLDQWDGDISVRAAQLAGGLAQLVPGGNPVTGGSADAVSSVTLGDLAVYKATDAIARLPEFNLPPAQHATLAGAVRQLLLLPDLVAHTRRLLETCPRLAAYAEARPVTP